MMASAAELPPINAKTSTSPVAINGPTVSLPAHSHHSVFKHYRIAIATVA